MTASTTPEHDYPTPRQGSFHERLASIAQVRDSASSQAAARTAGWQEEISRSVAELAAAVATLGGQLEGLQHQQADQLAQLTRLEERQADSAADAQTTSALVAAQAEVLAQATEQLEHGARAQGEGLGSLQEAIAGVAEEQGRGSEGLAGMHASIAGLQDELAGIAGEQTETRGAVHAMERSVEDTVTARLTQLREEMEQQRLAEIGALRDHIDDALVTVVSSLLTGMGAV